jgi:2-polyprenyl-3-methyl-5-hydroxy-6-metoxy-1,4-benzoquinol methylase
MPQSTMLTADTLTPVIPRPRMRTEQVPCGVCGSAQSRLLFRENYSLHGETLLLGIRRCLNCNQVYVSPRLTEDSAAEVYQADRVTTISHQYCWAGDTSDARFNCLLTRLCQRMPQGRLLDVGCGTGSFLAAARRRTNWEVVGVEPIERAAQAAEAQTGAEVHHSTLERAALPQESFDIVSLLGVLEHVPDPLNTLRQAHRLLRPHGLLAVYVPNFHYLRCKDTGPVAWLRSSCWSRLAPQEHLFQFTPGSLQRLLDRAGFEVVRMDVGHPFVRPRGVSRLLKMWAFHTMDFLYRATGIHLGGIELIAKPRSAVPCSTAETW